MKVVIEELHFTTKGEIDMVDITDEVERFVERAGVRDGHVLIFVPGATGAVVALENEDGLVEDFKRMMEELIPKGKGYRHDIIDNNAHSHLRASLLGPSLALPVIKGKLVKGIWQQIFFVELDVRPRHRKVVMHLIGEGSPLE